MTSVEKAIYKWRFLKGVSDNIGFNELVKQSEQRELRDLIRCKHHDLDSFCFNCGELVGYRSLKDDDWKDHVNDTMLCPRCYNEYRKGIEP
jgi:hypothetical protein